MGLPPSTTYGRRMILLPLLAATTLAAAPDPIADLRNEARALVLIQGTL